MNKTLADCSHVTILSHNNKISNNGYLLYWKIIVFLVVKIK